MPMKIAKAIVMDIICDLSDRRGLRQEWEQIDPWVLDEIRLAWENIVQGHLEEADGRQGGERDKR